MDAFLNHKVDQMVSSITMDKEGTPFYNLSV